MSDHRTPHPSIIARLVDTLRALRQTNIQTLLQVVLLPLCLYLGLWWLLSPMLIDRAHIATSAPNRLSAWDDCRSFVERSLARPATAVFPAALADGVRISRQADERWSVLGYVDTPARYAFACQLGYTSQRVILHQFHMEEIALLED